MGFVNDLENKIKDYLDGMYEVIDLDYIPHLNNVGIGKKAYKVKLCAFSIDMRNSSNLLIGKWKQTSAKVHKAFLTTCAEVIVKYGGRIRDFQGDSILAFWPAKYVKDISNAVRCAMVIKWLLREKFYKYFNEYIDIDFGIGIDFSDAYIIRAGITDKDANNDLVYIAKSVNFAVAISNKLNTPYNIGVSESVLKNIDDNVRYTEEDTYWGTNKIDMWSNYEYIEWGGNNSKIYTSNYHIELKS